MVKSVTSQDVLALMPLYPDLMDKDKNNVIPQIRLMYDSGNMYASYVLGIYYLFGQLPRHYNFNNYLPAGEVVKSSNCDLHEETGLYFLTNLLKMDKKCVEVYQLKGLFDLFKIIQGKAVFFKTNDIRCRPSNGDFPHLIPLFSNADQIMFLLVDLDHYEIYLDYAEYLLERSEKESDADIFKKAISYFERIIADEELHSAYDLSRAYFLLGKLYLLGADFLKPNFVKGVNYLEASRLDDAYILIIEFYTENDRVQYEKSIHRCIGLIQNVGLKKEMELKYGISNDGKIPDITGILNKIFNLSFFIDEQKIESEILAIEESIEDDQAKDKDALLAQNEIMEAFDPSIFLLDSLVEDIDDSDEGDEGGDTSSEPDFDLDIDDGVMIDDFDEIRPPDYMDD